MSMNMDEDDAFDALAKDNGLFAVGNLRDIGEIVSEGRGVMIAAANGGQMQAIVKAVRSPAGMKEMLILKCIDGDGNVSKIALNAESAKLLALYGFASWDRMMSVD